MQYYNLYLKIAYIYYTLLPPQHLNPYNLISYTECCGSTLYECLTVRWATCCCSQHSPTNPCATNATTRRFDGSVRWMLLASITCCVAGYMVVPFWAKFIYTNLQLCIHNIKRYIRLRIYNMTFRCMNEPRYMCTCKKNYYVRF